MEIPPLFFVTLMLSTVDKKKEIVKGRRLVEVVFAQENVLKKMCSRRFATSEYTRRYSDHARTRQQTRR